jgi:hypothetical protein
VRSDRVVLALVLAMRLADAVPVRAAPSSGDLPTAPAGSNPPGHSTFPAAKAAQKAEQPAPIPRSLENVATYLNGRTLFLEKNYVLWNIPEIGPSGDRGNTPLLLEAWIAPHLAFFDGLYELDRPSDSPRPREHHFALLVTPEFRLRMIKNGGDRIYSSPVRPMSFMPRLDVLEYFIWRVNWGLLPHYSAKDQGGGVFVLAPRASAGHHSNGQEHCPYGDESGLDGADDPRCTAAVPGAPANTVNFRSGDFSTDYFGGGANAAYYTLDNGGFEHLRVAAGLLYKYNPVWSSLPGAMNSDEAALYGKHSLHMELEFQGFLHHYYDPAANTGAKPSRRLAPSADGLLDGKLRLGVGTDYFWTTGPGVPSYLASVEASYALFRLGGAGLFVRFSRGRDYLNILYVEPAISSVQFGVVFEQEPLFAYHAPPP